MAKRIKTDPVVDYTLFNQVHRLDAVSVSEERSRLNPLARRGAVCQACEQGVHVHSTGLRKEIVLPLMWLALMSRITKPRIISYNMPHVLGRIVKETSWVPEPERDSFVNGGAAAQYLPKWGFIASPDPTERRKDGSKRTGKWYITAAGIAFALEGGTAPFCVDIYNGRVCGFRGPMVTVQQVLPESFDFNLAMSGERG